jgi:hypothetical protein
MDHLNDFPEHTKWVHRLPYDHTKLREEKEQMQLCHEEMQRDWSAKIPFEEWYERAWKWRR